MNYSKYLFIAAVSLCFNSCKNPEDLNPTDYVVASQPTLFRLEAIQDSLEADGASFAEVQLIIDADYANKNEDIVFRISPAGKFSNGLDTLVTTADINGIARAFVQSSSIGVSSVNASIVDVASSDIGVVFLRAYPDQLLIEPTNAFVDSITSSVDVSIQLSRALGTVSPGLPIVLTAEDLSQNQVGIFTNTTLSDSSGLITSKFTLTTPDYTGFVRIKGTIATPNGEISGETIVVAPE